jgi:hypothetical protein
VVITKPFPVNPEAKAALWEQAKLAGLDELLAQWPGAKLVAMEIGGVRYGEPRPKNAHTFTRAWAEDKLPRTVDPEVAEAARKEKLRVERNKARMGKSKR